MINFNIFKSNLKHSYSGIVIRMANSMLHHIISINNISKKDKQQQLNDAIMKGNLDFTLSEITDEIDKKKKRVLNNLHQRCLSFSKITRKTPHIYPKVKKDEM